MVGPRALNIVYFGTPEFAAPGLRALTGSRHHVVALVSQPDRPRGRGQQVQRTPTKALAMERRIPVYQPERLKDPAFLAQVAAHEPDLGVVAAYGRILPDVLLAVPRLGMINVHGSILPAYRGAAPVHRAVIAGEEETGVTIMRVVTELDAGPTFAMRPRPIGGDETSGQVEQALAELGAELLLEVVDLLSEGRAVETPQDDSRATYAPKLTKAEGRIDWSQPARAIHNLVRGLHPWPLAAARLGDTRLLIHRTEMPGPEKVPATFPAKVPATGGGAALPSAPGTIASAGSDGLLVQCGDGKLLRILEIQPEGKRVMLARDFLAGHPIAAGAILDRP
jgi:methionyl-tRNA formyltransferase